MGRKSDRPGKHVSLHLAGLCLLISTWTGCQHPPPAWGPLQPAIQEPALPADPMEAAEQLFQDGDFSRAILAANHVVSCCLADEGDRALYLLGLTMVHPDNPAANPPEALNHFKRLAAEFPDSPKAPAARAWSAALSQLITLETKVETDSAELKKLREETATSSRRIKDLKQQIEQLKAVDIGTEENRRTNGGTTP